MKETNEQKQLRKYVLGKIGDDEQRSAIEEQIMTDDVYFQKLTMVEEDLIQDYVDENLDPADRANFEKCFLISAENRRKVKFARALRKYVDETKAAPEAKKKPPFFASLKAFFTSPVPATLAVLIILGFAGFFIWKSFSGSTDSEILIALNKAYRAERPIESRITDLDYAPPKNTRGGANDADKTDKIERDLAKTLALKAVSENPTAENLHNLGRVYLAEKDFDKAIEQFEKAVKLSPNNAKLHNDFGVALMEKANSLKDGRLENLANANEEFSKAIELDKNLPDAYFNQALTIQALNLPNQAREAWQKYLELDSTSKWAEEARKNLETLETTKPVSKTKEEILREFLEAKQTGDHERAWQTLSRNREMITGKLIPQQLAFLFVDAKSNGDEIKAKEYLDALIYTGKLEEEKSGDLFWKEIAGFYSAISNDKITILKQAQDSVRNGYDFCLKNKYDDALKEFESAQNSFLKTENTEEAKFAQYWTGYFLFLKSRLSESNSQLDQVAEFSQKNNYKWLLSQTLGWLSVNAGSANQYSKAIEYGKKTLHFAEEVEDTYNAEKFYSITADNLRQLGQYKQALEFAENGLEKGNLPEASLRQKWRDYDTAASIFYSMRLYKASENYRKEALNLALTELNDNVFTWQSYAKLGITYGTEGNYPAALEYLEKGRQVAEGFSKEQGNEKRIAYIDLQIAHIKRQSGDNISALESYDKAVKFYDASEYQANKYDAHKGRLLCYLAAKNDSAVQQELPVILDIFRKSRKEILEEQNRNSYFDNEQDVYDLAVAYEFDRSNYEKAFDYSEESRSRSLLDLINSKAEVSDTDLKPEIKFSPNISEPQSLSQIRAEIPEQVQIAQYAVLQNKIVIWLITKDDFITAQTEIALPDLQEKVSSYLALLNQPDSANAGKENELATELYRILIDPIKDKLDSKKEICLIPDKSLFRLPFAALVSPETEKYLISDYSIFYAPSTNVFLLSSKNALERGNNSNENLLSIGNPAFNRKEFAELPKLTSAENEAKEIRQFYKDPIQLISQEATKDKVKQNLSKADVVHFAGHYVVDEQTPLLSGFVLTESPSSQERKDSVLANYEIIGEKLTKTKLIILSACQTGVEGFYKGEGMFGASRTFLATGVPLIVATDWSVDSDATAELMINFHRYRKRENTSTVAALRKAQLDMLNAHNGKFHHPYFWAGFITLGGYAEF